MSSPESSKNQDKKIHSHQQVLESKFESNDPKIILHEGSVQKISQLQYTDQSGRHKTTYHWKAPESPDDKYHHGNGSHYPILSTETVTHVVKGIIRQNLSDGFSLITLVGKSGSGKTTLTKTAIHRAHELLSDMGHEYAISWYRRQAIGKIDSIIDSLPKGVNRIMVFDDATFGDRDLTEDDAKELIARLTYIRHDLGAKVIVFIIMHYSKGLGPFLRDGNVTWWTSISHIEKENMYKTYGWENKAIIRKFFKKYGSMLKNGFFTSELNESEVIWNYTKEPFKAAFCADYSTLHFTNYPAEECAYCTPKFDDEVDRVRYKESASERDLIHDLQDSYKHPSYIKQVYRWSMFFKGGVDCVEPKHKAIHNRITDYYSKHPEEFNQIVKELQGGKSIDTVLIARGLNIKRTDAENMLKKREKQAKRQREYDQKAGRGDGSRIKAREARQKELSLQDLGKVGVHYASEQAAYYEDKEEDEEGDEDMRKEVSHGKGDDGESEFSSLE